MKPPPSSIEFLESRIAPAFGANFDLSGLNGGNGFKINGAGALDHAGLSVSDAGDVNGDGISDLIIGAPFADEHASSSGVAYVIFGQTGRFAPAIDLGALNGQNGFKISGVYREDNVGWSVSRAGDINGD